VYFSVSTIRCNQGAYGFPLGMVNVAPTLRIVTIVNVDGSNCEVVWRAPPNFRVAGNAEVVPTMEVCSL